MPALAKIGSWMTNLVSGQQRLPSPCVMRILYKREMTSMSSTQVGAMSTTHMSKVQPQHTPDHTLTPWHSPTPIQRVCGKIICTGLIDNLLNPSIDTSTVQDFSTFLNQLNASIKRLLGNLLIQQVNAQYWTTKLNDNK
eukprot:9432383-Ditylum_brightwellii.AAC.1